MAVLWCEGGSHAWQRPRQRGRPPRSCLDHADGATLASRALAPAAVGESHTADEAASASVAEPAFARRLKALLRTVPFHELEATKPYRSGEWEVYDLRALALLAIDTVVDHMEIDRGVGFHAVVSVLEDAAARLAPGRAADELRVVATAVVEHLLNEESGRSARPLRYVDLSGDGPIVWQRSDVRILVEHEERDGSISLRATPEAINVLVGAIDVDVASQQEADEVLLDAQLRRGRVQSAEQLAQRARLLSVQYTERLRRQLDMAQQDLARIDWDGALERELDDAYRHLDDCMAREQRILAYAWKMLEAADIPEQREVLSRTAEVVDECLGRHLRLHRELMPARRSLLAEQERQRLSAPVSLALPPALLSEILDPLLSLPALAALQVGAAFARAVIGPIAPRLLQLDALVAALLQPRVARDLSSRDAEVPVLEDQAVFDLIFDERTRRQSHDLLVSATASGPARLGDVLETAVTAHGSGTLVADLCVLTSLWAYAPETHDGSDGDVEATSPQVIADCDGRRLPSDAPYRGDDLVLRRIEAD